MPEWQRAIALCQGILGRFSDDPALPKLQVLQEAYPNTEIYLSGTVVVDFPKEIVVPIQANQYGTATLAGETLTMDIIC